MLSPSVEIVAGQEQDVGGCCMLLEAPTHFVSGQDTVAKGKTYIHMLWDSSSIKAVTWGLSTLRCCNGKIRSELASRDHFPNWKS